jgi:hypothetical protein
MCHIFLPAAYVDTTTVANCDFGILQWFAGVVDQPAHEMTAGTRGVETGQLPVAIINFLNFPHATSFLLLKFKVAG